MGWVQADRKRARAARVVRLLRERKREKLANVAWELGYSYHYFRYSIVPELVARIECIEYDKASDELRWVCEEVPAAEAAEAKA